MVEILKNQSLQNFNTFNIESKTDYFAIFINLEELEYLLKTETAKQNTIKILGGGSNILLTQNQNNFILKNNIKGIELIKKDELHYYVTAGAGEMWNDFVMWCIDKNYQGVENLSLIPGTVGAAPMQNIGAYGAEIKDVFYSLQALEIDTLKIKTFTQKECEFGYRESVFKKQLKDKFIILNVTFCLNKIHNLNTNYGAIQEVLNSNNIKNPTIKNISDAVISIRESKLPNPKIIGNAGSFFKNPEINISTYNNLKANFSNIPGYIINETTVKVPAGWLIENCGWKGYKENNFGVHTLQALVLVNYGGANGSDVYNLSSKIIESVKNKFNIELEREVNIW